MKALFILDRCRDYPDRVEETTNAIRRRKDVLKTSKSKKMRDEVANLEAQLVDLEKEHEVEMAAATRMIDMLPPVRGDIVHMFYLDGLSYVAIAQSKHYSSSYVRKQVGNGRKQLGNMTHSEVRALLPDWYVEKYNKLEV